jgi:hypothetical protein
VTLDELLRQARVYDRFDGVGLTKTARTLPGYCHLVALHLNEAISQEKLGRPVCFKGKEGKRVLQGLHDKSLEDPDVDYEPQPGEPIGYGSDLVDALLVLLALCREHRVPVEQFLKRKLKSRRSKR